jgi:Uma2 family endonuclease
MAQKFQFYNRYGVEEYYLYDPDSLILLEQERSRSQALESKLREMGIDPNQLS